MHLYASLLLIFPTISRPHLSHLLILFNFDLLSTVLSAKVR